MNEGGRTDEAKGRAKEAAGAIADDPELRREGKADQLEGKAKRRVESWIDRLRNWLGGRSRDTRD
ncbi:MAG: CsbD family protein [Myxococcota bacterium]|nr:CsbD family protein [Myxococcota bacterium]